jgi:probable HAF family extracellular repeat protein
LGTLGGLASEAHDINDQGQVVGWCETATGLVHAFGWTEADGMLDLTPGSEHESCALGINEAGAVVGWYAGYSVGMCMSWDGTEPTPLGSLGGPTSEARAINIDGQIVGWGETASGSQHAFLWTEGEGMVDLNDHLTAALPYVLTVANDINDSGVIAVTAVDPDTDEEQALVLVPASGPGDCDGDGDVDLGDFSTFSVCFGLRGPTEQCPENEFDCCDLNGDGWINLTDFNTFQVLFGTVSTSTVPNCGG